MLRLSLVTSVLLAFALTAVVLAGLFFFNILPAPRVAGASPPPLPSGFTFPTATPTSVAPTAEASVSAEPTASVEPVPGGTYTVQPGDSLTLIGTRFGIPWLLIAEANGIEAPDYVIQPGQVLVIPLLPQPSDGSQIYVVQPGDSVIGIAEQFEIDPTELADFNNLADWNSIQPGQILYIPEPGSTPLPLETPEE